MDLASTLDDKFLKSLRKLTSTLAPECLPILLRLYLKLLRSAENRSLTFIITLANDALAASEPLKGSQKCDEIEYLVHTAFAKISTSEVLEYNQYQTISGVLQKQNSPHIDSELETSDELIYEGDILGMQMLISTFCSFTTYREQFICIESGLEKTIDSLKSIKTLDLFIQLFNFLNTLVLHPVYSIEHSGQATEYVADMISYYTIHTRSFKCIWEIVTIVLDADAIISQNLIKIIPKMWSIYKENREEMFPDIIFLLKKISKSSYAESIQASARFVYSIFTDLSVGLKFKRIMRNELGDLFEDPSFREYQRPQMALDSCKINDGFPLFAVVEAGEKFVLHFDVTAGCILYCAFVLDSHDINFSVSTSSNVLVSFKYVKEDTPSVTKIMLDKGEIVTVQWDNSFSWMNSKQVRYRVMVLRPVPKECTVNSYKKKAVSEGVAVSALVYDGSISIITSDIREEIYQSYSGIDTVKDFVEKFEKYSLNIVSCLRIGREELRGLEDVVWGMDIEVAAIYACRKLGISRVIVVSNLPCPRSCVVVDQKVLKNSSRLGDISRLVGYGTAEAVKIVADLFPGSEVVLFECKDRNELKEEIVGKNLKVTEILIDCEIIAGQIRDLL